MGRHGHALIAITGLSSSSMGRYVPAVSLWQHRWLSSFFTSASSTLVLASASSALVSGMSAASAFLPSACACTRGALGCTSGALADAVIAHASDGVWQTKALCCLLGQPSAAGLEAAYPCVGGVSAPAVVCVTTETRPADGVSSSCRRNTHWADPGRTQAGLEMLAQHVTSISSVSG